MRNIGDNGGPPLTDADVPDMTYVKFYPADFLTGTIHLTLEQRGAYITALCVMYDRMSGFPYDEKEGAVLLRVDKRIYRRVRDDLLADGKFYRDGDVIRNRRVEDEIRSYISEYVRRSNAAREREAKRKLARTSSELPPNLSRTSPELIEEVQKKSGELEVKNTTKTTDRGSQQDHIPEARSQKLEARSQNKKEREVTPLAPQMGGTVGVALRAGEELLAHGVIVNCETVRHPAFQVSIAAVEMQLNLQSGLGLTPDEAKRFARDGSIAQALAWAAEIENGRSPADVLPRSTPTTNFVRGSIVNQLTKKATVVRDRTPSQTKGLSASDALRALKGI